MLEASHNIARATTPANTAALRAFFNFSFLSQTNRAVVPTVTGVSSPVSPGTPMNLSFTVPSPAVASNYTAVWSSSCGGTFSPSNSGQNVTFTPPVVGGSGACNISVLIQDNCGRETFSNIPITVQCNLMVSTNLTPPCHGGGTTGAIAMTFSGGSGPYSYTWTRTGGGSGSGTGTTISNLSAGTYNVTVTTASGCTATFSRTLTESPQIVITSTPAASLCNGESTGGISISVSGGTPGYTYAWGDGHTTATRSGLAAGMYALTVTDSRSCSRTASITVSEPSAISISPAVTDVNCFGEASGAIALTVSGGTAPYKYLWSDGGSTQNRTGLKAATYSVTVTDANNCTKAYTNIQVSSPAAALSLSPSKVNVSCNGGTNGSITVTPSGGTPQYSYDWTGNPSGEGTPSITGLSAGAYGITVTDAKGCTASLSTTVTEPAPLVLTTVPVNPTCPPTAKSPVNSDGSITISLSGSTGPFTYAWSTANGSGLNATNKDQTGLTSGTYQVTVTNTSNGCTATTSVRLSNINSLPQQPGTVKNN